MTSAFTSYIITNNSSQLQPSIGGSNTSDYLKGILESVVLHILHAGVVEVVAQRQGEAGAYFLSFVAHDFGERNLGVGGVRGMGAASPVAEHQEIQGRLSRDAADCSQEQERRQCLHYRLKLQRTTKITAAEGAAALITYDTEWECQVGFK